MKNINLKRWFDVTLNTSTKIQNLYAECNKYIDVFLPLQHSILWF